MEGVDDQLQVSLAGADRRGDDELRGVALQMLMWDMDVPADWVDITVQEGCVYLTGDVDFQYQRDAAFDDVASLRGVVGVTDNIHVGTE